MSCLFFSLIRLIVSLPFCNFLVALFSLSESYGRIVEIELAESSSLSKMHVCLSWSDACLYYIQKGKESPS